MKRFFAIFTGGCIGQLLIIGVVIALLWSLISLVVERVDEAGSVPKALGQTFKYVKTEFKDGITDSIPIDTLVIQPSEIK